MEKCAICGAVMDNPRRVQCGKIECKRAAKNAYMKRYLAEYKLTTDENYRTRYRQAGSCEVCGAKVTRDAGRARRTEAFHCSRHAAVVAYTAKHDQSLRPDAVERRRSVEARRKARARAIRRAALADGDLFDPQEIFERDGWQCGICRDLVCSTLRYPHPESASLDHVVPLAAGGKHVRANVQCSHLKCNLLKGTRVIPSWA